MKPEGISKAKDPVLRSSLVALRCATELARKTAIQTDTDLIVVRDGKLVRIPAAVLREQAQPKPAPNP